MSGLLPNDEQMPFGKGEAIDDALAQIRDELYQNLLNKGVQFLQRQLEEGEKRVKLLQDQKVVLLEAVQRQKGLQKALEGHSDTMAYGEALSELLVAQLEKRLEQLDHRLQELVERLESQRVVRVRVVNVGVQVGPAGEPSPNHSRKPGWLLTALCSASLVICGLLHFMWSGGVDVVLLHHATPPS